MRPVILSVSYVAGAVGAIAASQTPAGAGNLLINGSLASAGVATLDAQRLIGITSAGDDSNRTFVITGTDNQGRVISETLTGPNAATVLSTLNYKTITKITISGAAGTALTVDTVSTTLTGASQVVPLDLYLNPFNVTVAVEIIGTLNATAQFTLDDIFGGPGPFTWYPITGLVGITSSTAGTLISAVRAVRLLVNTGNGSAQLVVNQSGAVG